MIALVAMAAAAAVDIEKLQRQLDYMVAICRADDVVRFAAKGGDLVSIEMKKPGQLPTVSENKAFQCALARLKARSDLKIGFTGNEAAPEVKKK